MSLSSRNHSIFNTFRLILPCVAPVCEGMHYHKTGVPWQMNNTFIMFAFLLICWFSLILRAFPHFPILGKLAYFGICQQVFPLKSCKIGCKTSPILQLYNSPNYISFSSLFEYLQSLHAYKCSASRQYPSAP